MNLADKIIAKRERDETVRTTNKHFHIGELDDCGIPVPEEITYDYLCARTMKAHPRLYQKQGYIYEIGKVFPINKNRDNAMWYVGMPTELLRNNGHMLYWKRLLQLLPELSSDKIQVSKNIYWNIEKGRLEYGK